MADRSFASRRSDAGLVADFPAMPVLGTGKQSHAFALIGMAAEDLPRLRPMRDKLAAIWQGQVASDLGEQSLLVILFAEPTDIAVLRLGNVLPVLLSQGRLLTSFATHPNGGTSALPGADPNILAHIEIWWGGKRQRMPLNAQSRLSIAALWDMPEIHVHAPLRPESEARGHMAKQAKADSSGLVAPRQAPIPVEGAGEISFDDAVDRDRKLDERTQLKSIATQIWGNITGRKRGQGEGRTQEKEPSVLANMAGWWLWHTPLGVPLARRFAQRMKLVERLMASGDIDSALRLALQLGSGAENDRKTRYPTRLPGMRTSLDFNISGATFSAPVMYSDSYRNLQQQYYQLADRMERDGDFKRAAYIRAQLQGNHTAAVHTLARGKMFKDAAKLAMDAKLPPILIIEMFYKAGEPATALAIAKREDCFDQLAEESRNTNPEFHAYVLRAWTDRLIETNQPFRALQVTDFLANEPVIDPKLLERRLAWIDIVFDESGEEMPPPEAVARALLSTQWADEAEALSAFAQDRAQDVESRGAAALDAVRWWANAENGRLSALFDQLFRMGNEQSGAQQSFWKLAAPLVIERISLALIAHSHGVLSENQKDGLPILLRKARAEVLATDLRKLKLQRSGSIANQQKWTLPEATMQTPTALRGCFVGNDTILVWRDSGLLQLLDPKGRILWQGNMDNVDALIPVGVGSDVLIVQQAETGKLLSRFSTSRRAFSPIGQIDLTAYHDITSEGQWLVQIGEQIGALDLAKLCAPQPELEFLWASQLSASVEVISFLHHPGNPQWLTRDASDTLRNGLLEAWSLQNGRTLQTLLVRMESNRITAQAKSRFWYWQNCYDIRSATNSSWTATSAVWTLELENHNCALLKNERDQGQFFEDRFLSCDRSRAIVALGVSSVECKSEGQQKRTMVINCDPKAVITCLARGTSPGKAKGHGSDNSHMLLLAANDGRIILVDLNQQNVTVF